MIGESEQPVIAMAWPKEDDVRAVETAGGRVRRLEPDRDDPHEAVLACAGLMLTGGPDVEPAAYGDAERHATVQSDPLRDRYELVLARRALERRVALLALCRGVQVLNVAAGGTLWQDLPTGRPGPIPHDVTATTTTPAHPVDVIPGTLLARALGHDVITVNSRHHQAIRRLASPFVVTATAPDGVIEAIEHPALPYCLGVQWHPENFWQTGEFAPLFRQFVAAAACSIERVPATHRPRRP